MTVWKLNRGATATRLAWQLYPLPPQGSAHSREGKVPPRNSVVFILTRSDSCVFAGFAPVLRDALAHASSLRSFVAEWRACAARAAACTPWIVPGLSPVLVLLFWLKNNPRSTGGTTKNQMDHNCRRWPSTTSRSSRSSCSSCSWSCARATVRRPTPHEAASLPPAAHAPRTRERTTSNARSFPPAVADRLLLIERSYLPQR